MNIKNILRCVFCLFLVYNICHISQMHCIANSDFPEVSREGEDDQPSNGNGQGSGSNGGSNGGGNNK